MEFVQFLRLVNRQKLVLILVPLLTVVITYFLVKNSPNEYVSTTQISTGITDKSSQLLATDGEQESTVNQKFSNLIEIIQLRKLLDQVSYQLMIHDLTSPTPFTKPSSFLNDLNKAAREHALQVFDYKYKKMEPLSLWDNDQKGLYKLLESMGYDAGTLSKNLSISRADYSDFIKIDYTSHDPQLSAFVVNRLSQEFINYITLQSKDNQYKAVNFLKNLLQEKRDAMNENIDILKQYKIRNRVLNLDEQAKSLYQQMADYETKREEVQKSITASNGALRSINAKFDPKDRQYLESAMTQINTQINVTKQRLQDVNDRYIQNNFNPALGKSVDSLKQVLSSQINDATDKYIFNPMIAKQSLVEQKLNLEIELELAKNSVNSISSELVRLNNKFDNLVPHEAVVQGYESNIDISSKEYLDVLNKYNQVSMEAGYSGKLHQVSIAMPGELQPSKKMLLVILSGIISFIFCLLVLFILFFFDDSIKHARTLTDKTGLPTLGYLNLINGSGLDLNTIWNKDNTDPNILHYKDLLRALRFEIDRDLGKDKMRITITSLGEGEGKTLFTLSLAYAYAKINKRVLVVDGNFLNSSISNNANPRYYIEDYLTSDQNPSTLASADKITVFGNRGKNASILEMASEQQIKSKLDALNNVFDIILFDSAALDNLDRAKEWILFSDATISIFEYGKTIRGQKKESIRYLKTLGTSFIGWVFNKTPLRRGN